ncbi:hypothetical protein D3C73_1358390 [compost metagenome]
MPNLKSPGLTRNTGGQVAHTETIGIRVDASQEGLARHRDVRIVDDDRADRFCRTVHRQRAVHNDQHASTTGRHRQQRWRTESEATDVILNDRIKLNRCDGKGVRDRLHSGTAQTDAFCTRQIWPQT